MRNFVCFFLTVLALTGTVARSQVEEKVWEENKLQTFRELVDLYSRANEIKGKIKPDDNDFLELGNTLRIIEGRLKKISAPLLLEKMTIAVDTVSSETCALEYWNTPGKALVQKLTAPVTPILKGETEKAELCAYCEEEMTPDNSIVHHGCGHKTCKMDAQQYAKVCLKDKNFPLYCPNHAMGKCDVESDMADILQMGLSEEEIAVWQLGEVKTFLEKDNKNSKERHWKFCKGNHCCQAVNVGYKNHRIKEKKKWMGFLNYYKTKKGWAPAKGVHFPCDVCGFSRCLDCGKNHPKRKKCSEDDKKNIEYIKLRFEDGTMKKCPGCQSVIEKNDGCKHMTCKSCTQEFHWDDLTPWKSDYNNFAERSKIKSKITEEEIREYLQ